jgi:hypothetical protein
VRSNKFIFLIYIDREKKSLNARGYLHFTTEDALRNFIETFNGHIYITPNGKITRQRNLNPCRKRTKSNS